MIGAALDWLRHVGRRRAMSADLVTGKRGEDLAHRYLRRQGYKIVARNYRLASGDAEADLIARDGADLVIVEVKTRQTDDYGPPDRAIGPEKLRHILRVAREYARRTETPLGRVRIDAVTVVLRSPPEIALFRGVLRFPG